MESTGEEEETRVILAYRGNCLNSRLDLDIINTINI